MNPFTVRHKKEKTLFLVLDHKIFPGWAETMAGGGSSASDVWYLANNETGELIHVLDEDFREIYVFEEFLFDSVPGGII